MQGDLVNGRTLLLIVSVNVYIQRYSWLIILQTHNIALVGPIVEYVVSVGLNGIVQAQGTDITGLLEKNPRLASKIEEDKKALDKVEEVEEKLPVKAKADGKLVVAEEIVEGHITWKSIKLLISGLGGRYPVLFVLLLAGSIGTTTTMSTAQTWFLGVWGSQYENHAPSEVHLYLYASVLSQGPFMLKYIPATSLSLPSSSSYEARFQPVSNYTTVHV